MATSTVIIPSRVSAPYWAELKNLSNEVKLELITLLSSSMRHSEEDWTESFAGKWHDNRATEDIIKDINEARNANIREVVL